MKKALLIIVGVLLIVLIGAGLYVNPLLPIATGYAAKGLASGIFLSERNQEDIENIDLNFSIVQFTKNTVNMDEKSVTSRFLWSKTKVVYDEDHGCTIVRKYKEEDVLDRPAIRYESTTDMDYSRLWPVGDQVINHMHGNVDYEALAEAYDKAFSNELQHIGTRALLVVHEGELIAEDYADGFDVNTRLLSWSMAKSFTNAMVGILSKEGKIDINKPMMMPGWEKDERANITWNNMMHMSSGLEWEENYGNESDVNVMLHKVGDFGSYTAAKKAVATPETVWNYSSGSTNVVCLAIRNLFNDDEAYYNFAYDELFSKINIKSAVFETDASGTFVGSSYIYATARDFARFGLLYLNDGVWEGERILPEGWVDYTVTPAEASNGVYGSYFWLNASGEKMPDAPEDTYFCQGHDGQWIIMVPSKDLVVVRLGYSDKSEFSNNLMMKDILAAFPE